MTTSLTILPYLQIERCKKYAKTYLLNLKIGLKTVNIFNHESENSFSKVTSTPSSSLDGHVYLAISLTLDEALAIA